MSDATHDRPADTRLPNDYRWPGGKRVAVIANAAYEAWSPGKAPGIGPMGNVLQPGFLDLNALSWADYGHRRGIQRILRALERRAVKASVMVCGVLAEKHPETVRAIAAAGHEIVAHSYAMDVIPVYLDEASERDNIRRTLELIERASDVRPTGWISPRATPSPRTLRLLIEEGFLWHGDCLDDDLPYLQTLGARSIVAIPLGMPVNDLPISVRYGNNARAMVEAFEDELSYLLEHEDGPGKIDVTVHAHVYGRPTGIWAYEEILELARETQGVWVGTRAELAAQIRAALAC